MSARVHLREKNGGGGAREGRGVTNETPALTTSMWGMLYADDTGVVSQSPKQLKYDRRGRGRVRSVWPLTVSEAKTKIMC